MRGCFRSLGKTVAILLGLAVVLGAAGTLYWYWGSRLHDRSWDAYYDDQPQEALRLYQSINTWYPISWGPFEDITLQARYNAPELEDYLQAKSLLEAGQTAAAAAAFEAFITEHFNYPGSQNLYFSYARQNLARLRLEMAETQWEARELDQALAACESVLGVPVHGECEPEDEWDDWGAACKQADLSVDGAKRQARELLPEIISQWTADLSASTDCGSFIQYCQSVVGDYPEILAPQLAQSALEEAYAIWTPQLVDAEGFQAALEKLQSSMTSFPESLQRAPVEEILADLYADWSNDLADRGDFEAAIQNWLNLSAEYPATSAGIQARESQASTYCQWAAQLKEDELYAEAIEKYRTVLTDYSDTVAASEAEAGLSEAEQELAGWRERTAAEIVIEFPEALRRDEDERWSWTTVFKETGGLVAFTLRGEGWIVDAEGSKWGSYGSAVNRGTVEVSAGGQAEDSYWCSGERFIGGYAFFTWFGEDEHGHPIELEEKVNLLP